MEACLDTESNSLTLTIAQYLYTQLLKSEMCQEKTQHIKGTNALHDHAVPHPKQWSSLWQADPENV